MTVEFNVGIIFEKTIVTAEIKRYYEFVIEQIVVNHLEFIDTSKLAKVIIPDDFFTSVIEFQVLLGHKKPSVTNNEFGIAYGKVLHDEKLDKYFVFLRAENAAYLMDDTFFNSCFSGLNEEAKQEASMQRQLAINLLAHELSHIEFACHVTRPTMSEDYISQITELLYQLLDEYYACRRSSGISTESLVIYDEEYLYRIEEGVMNEKRAYQNHDKTLDEFRRRFHELTKQSLIGMVSALGTLQDSKAPLVEYCGCRLYPIVSVFRKEFDILFNKICDGENITIPTELISLVEEYFHSFGVYISQPPEGLLYEIL